MESTSLLDAGVLDIISGFGAQMVPTVLALVAIIVPVGLSLWGISFGIKKGMSYFKKNADKAV